MRIASFLSSATEIVYALGLEDRLEAVSHECDYPPEVSAKPRVTRPLFDPAGMTQAEIDRVVRNLMRENASPYVVDRVGLAAARPDLILAQGVCEVCAVSTRMAEEAAADLDSCPRVLPLDAHRIEDVFESVLAVGGALDAAERADRLVRDLRERTRAVTSRVRAADPVRVCAIEWFDPPFVPGHWVPEMIELAGGVPLSGGGGAPSREVAWTDLDGQDPDVLLVMPCGLDLVATSREAAKFADRLFRVAPRAVESGRAFVVDGSAYFSRSGPRVVTGIEILGRLFHPELCPDYPLDGRAARWKGTAS